MDLKVKNWAGFYESVKAQLEARTLLITDPDPYKSWEHREVKNM